MLLISMRQVKRRGKRGDFLSKYLEEVRKIYWFTTIEDEEDLEVLKAGWHRALSHYGTEFWERALEIADYWWDIKGLNKKDTLKIIQTMRSLVRSNRIWNKDYVVRRLMRVVPKLTRHQAETIATTELANLANYARMLKYQEETRVQKFVWVTEKDRKVCDKCKRLAEITRRRRGVTLAQLKFLIRAVCGRSARGWICHPNCRCTFTRYRGKRRVWE